MKDKGISRDIGKNKRPVGAGPDLGQVNRMPSQSEPAHGERRRKIRVVDAGRDGKLQDKQTRSALMMWSLAFGVTALVVLAVFFLFWLKPHLERREQMAAAFKQSTAYQLEPDTSPEYESLGEQEAITLVKTALKARSTADVNAAIRTGDATTEQVIGFLNSMKSEEGDIDRYQWLSRLDTTEPGVEGVLVNFKKAGKDRNRLALLVADDKGGWKMDFPAFARLASPAWSDLLERRAESATVRVYVAADEYFNGPFADESQWKCFGLASPDVPELLYGYCKVDSLQADALNRLLAGGKKMARATLVLHRVEGAANRQYLIKRVLAEDWAVREVAPDDR